MTLPDGLGSLDCGQTTIEVSGGAEVSELTAPASSAAVTIDGALNPAEWSGAANYYLDATNYEVPGVVVAGSTATPTDTSARLYLQHDANYVYVAVKVNDDQMVTEAAYAWEADCVELFLDHNNSRTENVGINRMQFDVSAGGATTSTPMVPAGSWQGAATRRADGYTVEFALSKAALGLVDGQAYGFDVVISDVEPAAGTIATRYWYFSTTAAETNESKWGSVVLAEGDTEAPPSLSVSAETLDFGTETVSRTVQLTNSGTGTLTYQITASTGWVLVSPSSGQVGASPITVTVSVERSDLAPGAHLAALTVDAGAAGSANVQISAAVSDGGSGVLVVTPADHFTSAGYQGDLFTPASQTYTLRNTGSQPLSWATGGVAEWAVVQPAEGTLAPGASTAITVSLNSEQVNLLEPNRYGSILNITNRTTGTTSASRYIFLTVMAPPTLSVSPAALGFGSVQTSLNLEVSNSGEGTLDYTATCPASWVTVSPAAGQVGKDAAHPLVTVNRTGLTGGSHETVVTIDAGTAGQAQVAVSMDVLLPATLTVTPSESFLCTGPTGGPFTPASTTYNLSNTGGQPLDWTASTTANWVTLSPTSGTLAAGASASVTVSLGVQATSLAAGNHAGPVQFKNTTNGLGNVARYVALTVIPPEEPEGFAEDFTGLSAGAEPIDWLDTAANNSLAPADHLFQVHLLSGNPALGTSSTLANIHSHYVGAGSEAWSNYEFTGRMMGTSASSAYGVNFLSDYPYADHYYRLRTYDGLAFYIDPHGTTITGGTVDTGVLPVANQWFWFRVQVENASTQTVLRAKVWRQGTAEPAAWQAECYDLSLTRRTVGTVGVWAYNAGNKYWDDLAVSGVTAPPQVAVDIQASTTSGTAPLVVNFQAVPRNAGEALPDATFNWNFGDGSATKNGTAVSHSFSSAGTFVVALTATLAGGVTVGCDEVTVQVAANNPPAMAVTSTGGLVSSGLQGGPFSPNSVQYTLTNSGGASLNWTAAKTQSWITLSKTSGALAAGATDTVTVSINSTANSLAAAGYNDTVTFTNTTNGTGNTTRSVSLTVNAAGGGGTMTAAHRTSGVAPLAVHFDVVGAGSGVVQPADGDYASPHYRWNFGDAGSGTWTTSGRSRNQAFGYVAAHVYESPGTYTASLAVTTPTGQTYNYQQTITVQAFSGTTYYVSNSTGADSNNGLSTGAPFKTFSKAVSVLGTNTRVLFKRGDTWTTASGAVLSPAGPGIIGAYGSGNRPVINVTGTGSAFRFSGQDWRIMDLDLVGPGASSNGPGIEGSTYPKWVNGLALRVKVGRFRVGAEVSTVMVDPHVGNMMVDCHVYEANINGVFLGGSRMGFLGNLVENTLSSHGTRIWQAHHAVYSENIVRNPGGNRPCLKFHGPDHGSGHPESSFTVISGNDFHGGTGTGDYQSVTTLEPENAQEDERVHDIVYENNIVRAGNQTRELLALHARRVTVRNNVFIGTGGTSWMAAIKVTQRGIEPAPLANRIYNNTAYRANAGDVFEFVQIGGSASDTRVCNNLGSFPQVTTAKMLEGSGSALYSTGNLITNTPRFVNAGADDFRLLAGSAAIDAGIVVPVPLDAAGNTRHDDTSTPNASSIYDLGAFEYRP